MLLSHYFNGVNSTISVLIYPVSYIQSHLQTMFTP